MTTLQEAARKAFEDHWIKTRGAKKAKHELARHPLQPQVYIQDSANRHWVTWQAALAQQGEQQPAAWLFTDVQSGDQYADTDPDVYRREVESGYKDKRPLYTAAPAPAPQPAQEATTGCACRWDTNDNRVATCVRHQGWLDVVSEWADRAKAAESALQSAQPVSANIQTKIVKDISAHEGGKQQLPPLPTTELDALGCAYCNHPLFLGSKCKNCGKEVK